MKTPAILDGTAAFPNGVPFARPLRPPLEAVMTRLSGSYEAGILTNGPLVRELEQRAAERLGAAHAVAVANCTAGLMLAVRAIGMSGAAVLPGFTFSATAHAVAWNGLDIRFAECDPATFQLDLDHADRLLDGAGGVLATHIFGAPCPAEDVERLGRRHGVPVVFDAAHGFGAVHKRRPVGCFGDAEVFSLSPTKLVVAGEGGIVTTPHAEVAEALRIGRDYGNPGDYDTRFVGLNARMSELHAALAIESLDQLDEHLAARRALAARYTAGLAEIPGITPQVISRDDQSTYKDYTVIVDAATFGLSRDQFQRALKADGVDTRRYFDPPVHRQQAYAAMHPPTLPVTEDVASRVLSLPMWGALGPDTVDCIVEVIAALAARAGEVRAAVAVG
jgi:dTDP-4-amino-4,6-dideoxygalactose transaminase